jgi:hypothetical protein
MEKEIIIAVLGFLGGLATPWVRWQVDKQKLKRKERVQLVKDWKRAISEFDFHNNKFGETDWYASLRSHMRPDVIKGVEVPRTVHIGGSRGENLIKQKLLDEVARLENGIWKDF